jgi:ATP-dependent Clp protease ATP-binding subunit ClpX
MENVMLDLMYRIPSDDSISHCVIDQNLVEENLKVLETNPFKLEDKSKKDNVAS